MHFDLFDPIIDVVKGGTVVNSVGQHDSHGTAVVGLSDGFEALLTCCVPDL